MTPFFSRSALSWLLIVGITLGVVYLLRTILLPFALGGIFAYLLNPMATRLHTIGIPRGIASLISILSFLSIFIGVGLLFIPIIGAQTNALIGAVPHYADKIEATLLPLLEKVMHVIGSSPSDSLPQAAAKQGEKIVSLAGSLVSTIFNSGVSILAAIPLLVLTLVLTFYWLRDWPKMLSILDTLWPRRHYTIIRSLLDETDACVSGFLRGQTLVALTLGSFYAITLTLAGLDFGVLIGVLSGILTFIPYVGSLLGGIASIGIATAQFGLDGWESIALVAGIYGIGQFLESNVFVPKFVGNEVGLHPVWIMFALLAGGSLFGFLGVVLAVPVGASIAVLIRFLIDKYRESALYAP
ncbi:MAG: AI-2E family transporter [Holosporales bacterium]|jgi:predicted PurR-regulated permease PerM